MTAAAGYPNGADYRLIFDNPFPGGLTGVRINTLYNSDLPSGSQNPAGGPGTVAGNGVLTEVSLFSGAVPEPGTGLLMAVGLSGLAAQSRRRGK